MRRFLLLGLALASFGCTTGKWQTSGYKKRPAFTPYEFALSQLGVQDSYIWNPIVADYCRTIPASELPISEEIARPGWCGAFVCWCLERAGCRKPFFGQEWAWKHYGEPVSAPQLGDMVVMFGHVAFYAGRTPDGQILILGGNQGYWGKPGNVEYDLIPAESVAWVRRPIASLPPSVVP